MNLKQLLALKASSGGSSIELYDAELYPITNGRYIKNDGTAGYNANYAATIGYIPCEVAKGKKISLNKRPAYGTLPCIAFYTDSNTTAFISAEANNGGSENPWVVDVPQTAKYVRFSTLADAEDLSLKVV
jgi:xanthine dehydrogenase iron-sulfur cluster and FAD-binding subunit A